MALPISVAQAGMSDNSPLSTDGGGFSDLSVAKFLLETALMHLVAYAKRKIHRSEVARHKNASTETEGGIRT